MRSNLLRTGLSVALVAGLTGLGQQAAQAVTSEPPGTVVLQDAENGVTPPQWQVVDATDQYLAVTKNYDNTQITTYDGTVKVDYPGMMKTVTQMRGGRALVRDEDTWCVSVVSIETGAESELTCDDWATLGPDAAYFRRWSESTGGTELVSKDLATGVETVVDSAEGYGTGTGPDGWVESTGSSWVYRRFDAPADEISLSLPGGMEPGDCWSVGATLAHCSAYDSNWDTTYYLVPLDGSPATATDRQEMTFAGTMQAWWDLDYEVLTVSDGTASKQYTDVLGLVSTGDGFLLRTTGDVLKHLTSLAQGPVTVPFDPGFSKLDVGTLAMAPGRVSWNDNTTADYGVWSRDLTRSGDALDASPAGSPIIDRASAVGLAISGDWTVYNNPADGDRGVLYTAFDGTRSVSLNDVPLLGGSVQASGSRVLVSGHPDCPDTGCVDDEAAVYDLVTGEKTPLPSGGVYRWHLWGDYVAYEVSGVPSYEDNAIRLLDLRTGSDRVLAENTVDYQVSLVGLEDGRVLYAKYLPESTQWLLQPVADGAPAEDVSSVLGSDVWLYDLSSNGFVGSRYDAATDTEEEVLIGFDGTRTALPATYGLLVSDDTMAWVGDDHKPRVAPLPHAVHKPVYLGNIETDTAPVDGVWKISAFTSASLTACEVAIGSAAGEAVRTVPCEPGSMRLGVAQATWDGTAADGSRVPAGTYDWSLKAGNADGPLQRTDLSGAAELAGQFQVGAGTPTNQAPGAGDLAVSTAYGTPVPVTLKGTDPDGDMLTYTHGAPTHGTVTGSGNALTYKPTGDFSGTDSFTYTVTDPGGLSATGTVTVTVGEPVLPGALSVRLLGGSAEFSWGVTDGDSPAVQVRRINGTTAPSSSTAGSKVYAGPATGFSDSVTPGETYSYAVWLVDAEGQPTERVQSESLTALSTPAVKAPARTFTSTWQLPFRVTWGGAGDPDGTRYRVEYKAPGAAWRLWQTTSARSGTFGAGSVPTAVAQGSTYAFRVTSLDEWDHATTSSAQTKARVAFDDRKLKVSRGWTRGKASKHWLRTYTNSSKRGASVTATGGGRTWVVYGDKFSKGSKFAVYVGRTKVGTFDSRSARTRTRQVLWSKTFKKGSRRTVKLVNLATGGRPNLRLDGFDHY